MATATKFMFGTDFREGSRKAASEADLSAARAEAFQAGQEQGRREAEAQFNGLAGQLARSAERLFALETARMAAIEAQAAEVALAAARALAGAALAEKPLAPLAQAVRECIGHARQAPHLVVRVNEASVEAAEELVKRLTREQGFSGQLMVLGEPDIRPGDGRIEWADGGFVMDSERLSTLIEQAVASVFPGGNRHGQ
ncbi:FliH/SctL family protein [Bosea thiooxidans]|nr:FliH/SctL family protein [Bosea sp. (in: a-proteobacteria)]